MRRIDKPAEGEFAPYTIIYIGLLPDDGRVLEHMRDNARALRELLIDLPESKLMHRYAPDKWTIKEIVGHLIDDERIYAYRALRFARNDRTELPGFEQDDYTKYSGANERTIAGLLDEFDLVRASTIALFESFDDEMLLRSGIANGGVMSVRAAAYHLAGHEMRHVNIIRERYL